MTLIQQRMAGLGVMMLLGAGAIGAVVWQQKYSSQEADRKTESQKLLSIASPDEVEDATLVTPNGTFVLHHASTDETGWLLQSPMKTTAEASTIDSMLRAALELQMTGRVGGKGPHDDMSEKVAPPSDLKLFGLDPPQYTLTLKTKSGVSQALLVGKKNSYDGSLFAKRGDAPDVGLVNGSFVYQLDKDLYKLREKRPFIASTQDIGRLQVVAAHGEELVLERHDKGYVLTAPLQTAADTTQAEALLGALTGLRAKLFAAEEATTPAIRSHFGLEHPAYTALLTLKQGGAIKLLFGELKLGDESHYFVMRDDVPSPVIELGSDWVFKKLGMSAKDLRDLHVVPFDRETVVGVRVKRTGEHGGELVFSKTHDAKDGMDRWLLDGNQVQSSKVMALVVKVGNLRADTIAFEKPTEAQLKASGLLEPSLQVDLTGEGGTVVASLHVGNEEGEHRLACGQARERIDRVQKTALDDISVQAADYQEAATAKSN